MLYGALLFFLLWAEVSPASQKKPHGGATAEDSMQTTSVNKRMDALERFVQLQSIRMDRLLREQDVRLAQQQRLIQQQRLKLWQQDRLLRQHSVELLQVEQGRVDQQPLSVSGQSVHPQTDDALSEGPSDRSLYPPKEINGSTLYDITSRSADEGALATVVDVLSKQVTQLDANFQAFQVQTGDDLKFLGTRISTKVDELKNSNAIQDSQIRTAQTSTFVQWGSSRCSRGSDLIYSGVVGGSLYSDSGAATNYLCLTMSPMMGDLPSTSHYATLWGAEYETDDAHVDKDPVCAVCRASYSTTVMIPGTNVCASGWNFQYSGFLMAGHHGHGAGSEFICVDSNLESREGGEQGENGKLLHYTFTRCGALPCAPYVNNKVALCVVCSK